MIMGQLDRWITADRCVEGLPVSLILPNTSFNMYISPMTQQNFCFFLISQAILSLSTVSVSAVREMPTDGLILSLTSSPVSGLKLGPLLAFFSLLMISDVPLIQEEGGDELVGLC